VGSKFFYKLLFAAALTIRLPSRASIESISKGVDSFSATAYLSNHEAEFAA
jgi:hypothetical protein